MFTQHQIEITRRRLLARLSDRARPNGRIVRGKEREQTWSFMLWSFIVVHVLDRFDALSGKAVAQEAEDGPSVDANASSTAATKNAEENDGSAQTATAETSNEAYQASAPDGQDADVDIDVEEENEFDGSTGSGTPADSLQPVTTAGPVGSGAPLPAISVQFTPVETLPPPIPDLDFFEGFGDFAGQLGFASDAGDILDALDAGVQSNVGLGFSFLQNPLTAVSVWNSTGDSKDQIAPNGNDHFDVDWSIQLNGVIGDQIVHVEGTSDDVHYTDTQPASQLADLDAKMQGNNAVFVDETDWDDLMVVNGNYHEFNTIVQINILWDNDTITADITDDTIAAGGHLGGISSGSNIQQNNAIIADVAKSDPEPEPVMTDDAIDLSPDTYDPLMEHAGVDACSVPTQLIMGDTASYNLSVQQNSIVDLDTLNYDIQDLIAGAGVMDITDQFADVYSGGHMQANDVMFVSGANDSAVLHSRQSFINFHDDGDMTEISGDYYEFNTIIQINIIEDSQELVWSGAAGDGSIASGGNFQFNNAAILQNDAHDELFVGGNYTEYNLVLQVNAIQDNDTIGQTSSITHRENDAFSDGFDTNGSIGTDGQNGSSGSYSTPDFFDPDYYSGSSGLSAYA